MPWFVSLQRYSGIFVETRVSGLAIVRTLQRHWEAEVKFRLLIEPYIGPLPSQRPVLLQRQNENRLKKQTPHLPRISITTSRTLTQQWWMETHTNAHFSFVRFLEVDLKFGRRRALEASRTTSSDAMLATGRNRVITLLAHFSSLHVSPFTPIGTH